MTHDGMWFLHCLQEFGIESTNKINKSAIKSLSSIEISRLMKTLNINDPIHNYDDFKSFFSKASKLMIPSFMSISFTFPSNNTMEWNFDSGKCFAYNGIKRLGVIDKYECGVLYRIKCWFEALNIQSQFMREIGLCNMHKVGNCNGKIHLSFNTLNA